jgi:CHAT domain-containing protein
MILDELAARSHNWRQRGDSSTLGLWQQLTDARTRLAGLAMREASGAGSQKQIAAARAETERLEEALAATDLRFRFEQKRARAGLDDVLARLEPNTALVSFVAGAEYRAFVASASGAVRSFNLGSASSIDRLVSRWRAEIDRERDSFGRNAVRNEAAYREAALALRRAVWDPLLPALAGARIVFLVPDGRLDSINFAALPSSLRSYLAETGPLLHVLNAERDLLREASASPSRTKALLAVGEPAFGTVSSAPPGAVTFNAGQTSTCANFAGMTFAPLASSGEEIGEAVRFARGQGWQTELLRGAAATEEAVKSAAHGQQVVHIATHGFFLPENCGRSETVRESPLLRAGLVFAGANTRRRDAPVRPEEDGILTAEEAASLDLDGTEWVVLSGCETGVGETRAGEGALGLRRAFEEAGARTQIASLWPVRDADAARWTESLYEARFVRHQSTVQAVAYAGRTAIARRRKAGLSTHPFYWAGFVASGDWR